MEAFDIVFMDVRMPVMDGLEATRAIRALGGAWSRVPIVALTANAFPEDVRMCREAGMNDFVAKPIRKKVLVERMAAMLADHPVVRAARASSLAPAPTARPASSETPVLEHEILDELTDAMGHGGVRAMFDGFVDETDRRLGLLRGLSCDRDGERIREEAHTLKGAAGTCGLMQLSELAATLEQSAATIAPAKYADLVRRLDAGFAAARATYDRALGKAAA
jgi:CheY-like chemotaxis protein